MVPVLGFLKIRWDPLTRSNRQPSRFKRRMTSRLLVSIRALQSDALPIFFHASIRQQGCSSSALTVRYQARSPRPLHKTIQHHLPPRLVEIDGELVAVDEGDGARTEFGVEHPAALGKGCGGARGLRHELAFDHRRPAAAGRGALRGAGSPAAADDGARGASGLLAAGIASGYLVP